MGRRVKILRAATVPFEMCHRGLDGALHGHSLLVEVWTAEDCDLDAFKADVERIAQTICAGPIEGTIYGRTFEDIGAAVLDLCDRATRVTVRLPTRGHVVEITRDA